jgi:polyether ionophore transport system permease protein
MSADTVVGRRAFRQIWVGAAIWALVFGASAAASALTYIQSFPTVASRLQIAATTGADKGLTVLLGPVSAIGTVGGYTVYKCYVFLTTIGAIWAILATTRLLRGEEDAGRWQLVLAGTTRPARATAATLVAIFGAVTVLFAGTTAIVLVAGRNPDVAFGTGETVLYGLSIAIVPAVFVGIGALTSQLSRTRRLATGLAMGGFGVLFVVRMIADAGTSTRWLLWSTPFGWTELMRPFTENNLWPLVPAIATTAVLCIAAATLAARRDVGGGVLTSRDVAPARTFGLGSPLGLATRLELPVLIAWCIGAAAAAFAFGIIANVVAGSVPESFADALEKFGVHGSFVDQYVGVAFLFVATVVALLPAGQLGAAAEEETSGRLVHQLAQPARRRAFFGGRIALGVGGIVVASVLAGGAAWAGAKTQGLDLGAGSMLRAGLNVVPTALVVLGIGALTLAVAPRAVTRAVYGVVAGSLIINVLSSSVTFLRGVDHVSLFHYMALAPAQDPDPLTVVITLAIAIILCVVGTVLFDRRDIRAT